MLQENDARKITICPTCDNRGCQPYTVLRIEKNGKQIEGYTKGENFNMNPNEFKENYDFLCATYGNNVLSVMFVIVTIVNKLQGGNRGNNKKLYKLEKQKYIALKKQFFDNI